MKTISGKQRMSLHPADPFASHKKTNSILVPFFWRTENTCFWNAMEIFQVFWANSMNNVNACKVIIILNISLLFHNFRGLCQITLWDTKTGTKHGALKLFSEGLLRKHNGFPSTRPTENQTLLTHTYEWH